jgi:hypothetical protein
MLLAKEQQDTWFGDMYGFLLDWANVSNIDLSAMQTRIYNDIKQ